MILLEAERQLPVVVEATKTQVLKALEPMHLLHTYDSQRGLETFLDDNLAQMRAYAAVTGIPVTGLTRVILFHRSPWPVRLVDTRMQKGHQLIVMQQPQCWMQLGQRLTELKAHAAVFGGNNDRWPGQR